GSAGALVTNPGLRGQAPSAPAIPKELASYRDIVKGVLPAVVSIDARSKPVAKKDNQPQRRRPRVETFPPETPEDLFRRFFDELPDSGDIQQIPRQSFGSGFIIDPKGVVLTNYHVVDGADRVEIQLKDGRKFTSRDIKGDKKNDLAIVRVNSQS